MNVVGDSTYKNGSENLKNKNIDVKDTSHAEWLNTINVKKINEIKIMIDNYCYLTT